MFTMAFIRQRLWYAMAFLTCSRINKVLWASALQGDRATRNFTLALTKQLDVKGTSRTAGGNMLVYIL